MTNVKAEPVARARTRARQRTPVGASRPRRRSFRTTVQRNRFIVLSLAPTVVALGIFVYGFIAYTIRVSLSKSQTKVNLATQHPAFKSYHHIATDYRFQSDIRNVIVFTVVFLVLAVALGLLLAILVHQTLRARAFFRTLFLFPYSLSFVVTGVIWRWMFTPSTGVNIILKWLGIPVRPKWLNDPSIVGDVSHQLNAILPGSNFIEVKLGIPLAIIPVAIAAAWQVAGFTMAMFLAALGGIPDELSEAAALDGASMPRYYRMVVLPLLRPTLISVLVILGFTSLKSFDLFVAIAGGTPGFITDVPGIYVFDEMFQRDSMNVGSAAAVVMLVLAFAVTVPYLIRSYPREHHK